ncbi:hypothetical protein ACIQYO_26740, partial [Methylobacterium sp. NPDC097178]|uniref:hypothetical protein n=1 Tax=Methylobacterium sp. NPDC097178 TaxID=3364168 RepID=UPI00383B5F66
MNARDYAEAGTIQSASLNPAKQNRDVASIAGAIDAAGRARQSLYALAEMAEAISEKLAGPHPRGVGDGEKEAAGPRSVVDQLHSEVRGMTYPLTR